jgi:coproporphyrinogen III oxidase
MDLYQKQEQTATWFKTLRDDICLAYEQIEVEYARTRSLKASRFKRTNWNRKDGGGGEISLMRGRVFEKVGVNISTVEGVFAAEFQKQILGAEGDPRFFATGISLVAHMQSPLIPAMHFNTRYIATTKTWFGGGADLTPIFEDESETMHFHDVLKAACDEFDLGYYKKFKDNCDRYFYLKHRNEPRGVGGIFYDHLNSGNFEKDFAFTGEVGKAFLNISQEIVRKKINLTWTKEQREYQLKKRGRYVEFNLLYDRGTHFGLMTDGNVEAILMSMPPLVSW